MAAIVLRQHRGDHAGLKHNHQRADRTGRRQMCAATGAKNCEIRADRLRDIGTLGAGSASIAANSFCIARADGAPRFSLSEMVSAYSSWITAYCFAKIRIARKRVLDPAGITRAQRSGRMPRQQRLDISGRDLP